MSTRDGFHDWQARKGLPVTETVEGFEVLNRGGEMSTGETLTTYQQQALDKHQAARMTLAGIVAHLDGWHLAGQRASDPYGLRLIRHGDPDTHDPQSIRPCVSVNYGGNWGPAGALHFSGYVPRSAFNSFRTWRDWGVEFAGHKGANISKGRDPLKAARDLDRRLLAPYLVAHAEADAKRQDEFAGKAAAEACGADLAKAGGRRWSVDRASRDGGNPTLYWSHSGRGWGNVRIAHGAQSTTLELHDLPPKVARGLLVLLAKHLPVGS